MLLLPLLFSRDISHKRQAMARTCVSCHKVFPNSRALDKHRASCLKKGKALVANLRSQRTEGGSSHVHKRTRVELPDVDNDGPPDEPPPTQSGRSGRTVCMPCQLLDYVPHGDMSLAHVPPRTTTPPEHNDRCVMPMVDEAPTADQRPHLLQTVANKLGAFRCYVHAPSWQPKNEQRLDLVCDSSSIDIPPPPVNIDAIHEISRATCDPFEPFPNFSTAIFMAAYFSDTGTKSEQHAMTLAAALQVPRFKLDELKGFNTHVENVHLDKYLTDRTHPFQVQKQPLSMSAFH